MSPIATRGAAVALGVIAFLVFVGVGITELNYASDHSYAYGPAKIIAWAAGGGAVLAAAVVLIALSAVGKSHDGQ